MIPLRILQALLQKGEVLVKLGNYEMALVYFHRGLKRYPKSQDFREAVERTERKSTQKGSLLTFLPACLVINHSICYVSF